MNKAMKWIIEIISFFNNGDVVRKNETRANVVVSTYNTEDFLKENETRNNVIVSTIMLNVFLFILSICILTLIGFLNVNQETMVYVTIYSVYLLFVPSIIGFRFKEKSKWIKYFLIVCLTICIAIICSVLTYTATLLMIVPILMVSRYYSKRFTIITAITSILLFTISAYMSMKVGRIDLNYIEIPKGTTITVEEDIETTVKDLKLVNENVQYTIIRSYISKLFIYTFIVVFACVQVSQSGKNMIEKQKELNKKDARIASELNMATSIQNHVLPSKFPAFPEHKEFDIYAQMTPAKEVGGDFYDMFLIDENHLAILIADVSGKGIPAALIMMATRSLIKNTALNGYSVDEVFKKINNSLCESNISNHFVTSWFAIIDLKNEKMEFVNAGHNPPLIYSSETNKYEFLKTKPNLILAVMNDTQYIKNELKLHVGDKVFLYTDGVTEATNEKEELYGENRLQEFLNKNIEQDVETTIKGVKADIDNFVGNAEQIDDITMLELLYKGKRG